MEGLPNPILCSILARCSAVDILAFSQAATWCSAAGRDDAVWRPQCELALGWPSSAVSPQAWGLSTYREVFFEVIHPCRGLPGIWANADTTFGGILLLRPEPPYLTAAALAVQALNGPPALEHIWRVRPKDFAAACRRRRAAAQQAAAQPPAPQPLPADPQPLPPQPPQPQLPAAPAAAAAAAVADAGGVAAFQPAQHVAEPAGPSHMDIDTADTTPLLAADNGAGSSAAAPATPAAPASDVAMVDDGSWAPSLENQSEPENDNMAGPQAGMETDNESEGGPGIDAASESESDVEGLNFFEGDVEDLGLVINHNQAMQLVAAFQADVAAEAAENGGAAAGGDAAGDAGAGGPAVADAGTSGVECMYMMEDNTSAAAHVALHGVAQPDLGPAPPPPPDADAAAAAAGPADAADAEPTPAAAPAAVPAAAATAPQPASVPTPSPQATVTHDGQEGSDGHSMCVQDPWWADRWRLMTFGCAHRTRHLLPFTFHRFRNPSVEPYPAPPLLPLQPEAGTGPQCTCRFPEVDPSRVPVNAAHFLLTFVQHIQTPSAWSVAPSVPGGELRSVSTVFSAHEHALIRCPVPITRREAQAMCADPDAHPLEGLWRGTYGGHGTEVLLWTRFPVTHTPNTSTTPSAATVVATSADTQQTGSVLAAGASAAAGSSVDTEAGAAGPSNSACVSSRASAGATSTSQQRRWRICAIKLVGDSNVPAGTVTLELMPHLPPLEQSSVVVGEAFRIPRGYRSLVIVPTPESAARAAAAAAHGSGPQQDGENAPPLEPLIVQKVHRARGQIAGDGFHEPQWTDVELIEFVTRCERHKGSQVQIYGVLWHALNSFSLFTRLHVDT